MTSLARPAVRAAKTSFRPVTIIRSPTASSGAETGPSVDARLSKFDVRIDDSSQEEARSRAVASDRPLVIDAVDEEYGRSE